MEQNNIFDDFTIEQIIEQLEKEIESLKIEINNKQIYLQELINNNENE